MLNDTVRLRKVIFTLLGLPILLWVVALLFLLRVVNIFDAVLMKFPGPWVIYGIMAIFPLLALILGVRLAREGRSPSLGRVSIGLGGLLLAVFLVVIGLPMLKGVFATKPPKNPSAPRPVEIPEGLPVFPGAQGFGTLTPAGRGGKIIEVTSLEDHGPGTLRAALEDPNPRIIVFRVGGTIELEEGLSINHPFVTVAGQTAPGDGITLKNAGLSIATHDVLVQHLRIRPGNEGAVEPENNDAISILGAHGDVEGAYNVVIDHVSASWGEDETISTWYGAHDITISWSIISEALNRSRHRKETHSAGLLIGDSSYNVSMHHNLLAHNDFRNPLIIDGGTHDFINNVIYNWGVLPAEIVDTDSNTFLNFIGNTFIPGPSTQSGPYEIFISPTAGTPLLYVKGNIGPHRPETGMDEWGIVGYGWGEEGIAPEIYRSSAPFPTYLITATSAAEAYEAVLAAAGVIIPIRDGVDLRIINEVVTRTGAIINSPAEVGGYPALDSGVPLDDSDHDGMPDLWERQMGLDPNDPLDRNGDLDQDGYTNVEEYLHSLLN